MKKRIAPILKIDVDITQPTRCGSCQFLAHIDRSKFCKVFGKTLRMVTAKNWKDLYYIHRCKQCRAAEVK